MFLENITVDIPFSFSQIFIIWFAVFAAYVIFGIGGFGTALIASPILALYMPVAEIVPLLALLDLTAASINLLRDREKADRSEIKRLVPFMVLGSALGAALLLWTQPRILLLALGIFVIAHSAYSLSGYRSLNHFNSKASIPFGFIGGIFSALFGSGGFLYAIYLAGRLQAKNQIRMTMSALISLSTLIRVILFLMAGIYSHFSILLGALVLAPAMIGGIYLGRHITLKISQAQFIRLVNLIILASGLFLLIRYFY